MSAWGPSTYSISRVISSWASYQPRRIPAALSPKDASVSWMVFSLMVSLLPVGLCTSRLARCGGLSAPPGRPSDGRLAPGGVHTPCSPHLLALAGVVTPDRSFPGLFGLVRIDVPLPSPAHDHGVEFLLDQLATRYVHLSSLHYPVCIW